MNNPIMEASTGLLQESSVTLAEKAKERSEKVSRASALLITILVHVVVFLIFALITVVTIIKNETPVITAVSQNTTVQNPTKTKMNRTAMSSSSRPAPSSRVPVISAVSVSAIAIPKIETDLLSDQVGLGTGGFGTGIQGEFGIGGIGGPPGGPGPLVRGTIDGIPVEAVKLGVVLDISGSMTNDLPAVRKEIDKKFKGAAFREVMGCPLLETDERIVNNPNAGILSATQSDVIGAMEDLIKKEKVDSIFWFCDLQDRQTEAGLDRLEKVLISENRKIKLFILSLNRDANTELNRLIRKTGGKVKVDPKTRGTLGGVELQKSEKK